MTWQDRAVAQMHGAVHGRTARRIVAAVTFCFIAFAATAARSQQTPKDVVNEMLGQERDALAHRDNYFYVANERSDRTGGHLWTERVIETPSGKVRLLIDEDGKPLPPARAQQERSRLANDAAHPDAFKKREQADKDDETHGRQILELLPKAFILENMKQEGDDWRIDFRPDPKYSPSGVEEKVLHGMSGWLLVNRRQLRLHHIEGRLPQDLNIGFGLLSVKAGSNFETTKAVFDGAWRTVRVISDIRGKAVLFKSISRNRDVARDGFKRVENNLTVAQAVAMLEH